MFFKWCFLMLNLSLLAVVEVQPHVTEQSEQSQLALVIYSHL